MGVTVVTVVTPLPSYMRAGARSHATHYMRYMRYICYTICKLLRYIDINVTEGVTAQGGARYSVENALFIPGFARG